jgi:hypothetical protein
VVGTSVAGQNNRYNNLQIDGGVNNDVFGLAETGSPGGQARARPIPVEAVKEFRSWWRRSTCGRAALLAAW